MSGWIAFLRRMESSDRHSWVGHWMVSLALTAGCAVAVYLLGRDGWTGALIGSGIAFWIIYGPKEIKNIVHHYRRGDDMGRWIRDGALDLAGAAALHALSLWMVFGA